MKVASVVELTVFICTNVSTICAGEGIAKGMIEGNCLEMCPTKEKLFRERISDIDSFERLEEGGPPVLAVKKFARNVSISLLF